MMSTHQPVSYWYISVRLRRGWLLLTPQKAHVVVRSSSSSRKILNNGRKCVLNNEEKRKTKTYVGLFPHLVPTVRRRPRARKLLLDLFERLALCLGNGEIDRRNRRHPARVRSGGG